MVKEETQDPHHAPATHTAITRDSKGMVTSIVNVHGQSDADAKKKGKEKSVGTGNVEVEKLGEDVFQDGAAATQSNFDGANSPDNTEPHQPGLDRKREMSKSARIIKAIYKKKGIKEELYDHEKEDKSVAGYGKKPKMQQIDKDKSMESDKAPQAAAVLSGGTTLTGQTRDTLEIDPLMKRPLRFDGRK